MARIRSMTPYKLAVLAYIEDYYTANRFPPSLREICAGINSNSTSSVSYAMEMLAEDGYLVIGIEGASRTTVPTFKNKVGVHEPTAG